MTILPRTQLPKNLLSWLEGSVEFFLILRLLKCFNETRMFGIIHNLRRSDPNEKLGTPLMRRLK